MLEERECYERKWFGYRFMAPGDATQLFVDAYSDCYRRIWKETRDLTEAESKTGIRGSDWRSDPRELTSVWRARQHADNLGIPYPFFIMGALRAAERRGARRPPRPNQLFKIENLVHVSVEWERWIDDGGFRPLDDPAFREENFSGFHAQVAYRDCVVDRIKAGRARPDLIARSVFIDRVLPEDRAAHEFGRERLADARREAEGSEPAPVVKVGKADMLPACFGLPQAFAPDVEPCASCPVRSTCGEAAVIVSGNLVELHGSNDPATDRKRALNAARQKRFRDRRSVKKR
jgi:hypothetical protein